MNKKIKVFALMMGIMMIFSSVALADYTVRYGNHTLKRGSGSNNSPSLKPFVANLQSDLNSIGYSCGVADGIYGSKTVTGVTNFQKAHKYDSWGLADDGQAGRCTKTALYTICGYN